ERNDLDAAFVRLKRGLDYLPWWGKADDFCLAYITLARIQLARGNRTDAVGAVEKAAQLVQTCGVFSEARSAVETTQVKLWLLQGDWSAVDRWADTVERHLGLHDPFRFEDESTRITQARVFIAQNKLDEAIRLLSSLEENARAGGRLGRLIEIMVLKALAMQKLREPAQASAILEKCLDMAEPEGYSRAFLDEGRPMQVLLTQWLARAGASPLGGYGPLRDYGLHLISQFDAEPYQVAAAQEKAPSTGGLVEPLTPRELEVLQLICVGDSNQTIADKLVITVSAVKKHTGNILGKLGVTSRAQAMVKARELGLFPGDK
ncbi:MAG TPA: LuxR C-terminal-related transcriptional regulator, partial [Anaerolineae bacterium]